MISSSRPVRDIRRAILELDADFRGDVARQQVEPGGGRRLECAAGARV